MSRPDQQLVEKLKHTPLNIKEACNTKGCESKLKEEIQVRCYRCGNWFYDNPIAGQPCVCPSCISKPVAETEEQRLRANKTPMADRPTDGNVEQ